MCWGITSNDYEHEPAISQFSVPEGGTLQQLPALRELDLSCNKGLSGGLSQLTAHLALLAHLESLDLHLCNLTHADLQALSESANQSLVLSRGRVIEIHRVESVPE